MFPFCRAKNTCSQDWQVEEFPIGYPDQPTPDKGLEAQQPKHCTNINNKDEDKSRHVNSDRKGEFWEGLNVINPPPYPLDQSFSTFILTRDHFYS